MGTKYKGTSTTLPSPGMKNWRSHYFGEHWPKLGEIRGSYDPKDVFEKPLTIDSLGE